MTSTELLKPFVFNEPVLVDELADLKEEKPRGLWNLPELPRLNLTVPIRSLSLGIISLRGTPHEAYRFNCRI